MIRWKEDEYVDLLMKLMEFELKRICLSPKVLALIISLPIKSESDDDPMNLNDDQSSLATPLLLPSFLPCCPLRLFQFGTIENVCISFRDQFDQLIPRLSTPRLVLRRPRARGNQLILRQDVRIG